MNPLITGLLAVTAMAPPPAAPAGISVIQASELLTRNYSSSNWVINFPSPIQAGSVLVLAGSLMTDSSASHPDEILTGITMSGVTWTPYFTTRIAATKAGSQVWIGTVTTGGATALTITHLPTSYANIGVVELSGGTPVGTPVTREQFTSSTSHLIGTMNFDPAVNGRALAIFWSDMYGVSSQTFTPPAGWVTHHQQNTGANQGPLMWFGSIPLEAAASVSITLGLSPGNSAGQVGGLFALSV